MEKELKKMLDSISDYNSSFAKNKTQKTYLAKILKAMSIIDRKFFINITKNYKDIAYLDSALGIGAGQTISQPSTVARMLFLLELKPGLNVLEVGTGSGWNAALISYLIYPGKLVSLERIENLAKKARQNINKLKKTLKNKEAETLSNLKIKTQNIFTKISEKTKYDRIILTAGIYPNEKSKIKKLAKDMLKPDGILVCPHKEGPLIIYRKNKKLKEEKTKEEYVFVTLISDI